jgi:ribosome-binding factor A
MSERQGKVGNLIQECAARFIQHEANTNPLITITRVDISPDLKRAIIFFTTIPDGKEADALIFLKRSASELRQYLKENARLKRIPHLEFFLDAGERHRQHIDEVMREIEKSNSRTGAE